ncbi:MAG: gliding motility-associated C-terminal domain-containing protein, partial [Flavobacteriales bacterium]|nr:gliding motility-associated C-terminal domain-containing protein [Flavobacteriales bacterium]
TGTISVLNQNQYTPPPVTYACINQLLTPNLHITTQGATGIGSPTNLPPGLSASFVGNDVVISGTPTAAGTYNYSIPLTGGCGSVSVTGSIEVITVNSYTGNTNISACINTPFTDSLQIIGATGIGSPTGLPSGVNALYNNGYVYIQGTATSAGTYNYTIPLTGGCGSVSISGVITIIPENTIQLISQPLTDYQFICEGQSILTIIYQITGTTSYSITGLPNGTNAVFDYGTQQITISGTPLSSGTYPYTISLNGGCGNIAASGTITVYSNPTPQATANSPVCEGGTLVLNVNVTGTPTNYQWIHPNGSLLSTNASYSLNNIILADTGYYYIDVTNGFVCTQRDSVYVTVVSPLDPVINLISLSPLCENDGFSFTVNGISGAQFQWVSPGGTIYNNQHPSIINSTLNDEGYWVITVDNGCVVNDSIYVNIEELPDISFSGSSAICPNEDIILTAEGGVSYQWIGPNGFNDNDSIITIINPTSSSFGWYSVTVQGVNGCISQDSILISSVTVNIEALPDTSVTDPSTSVTVAVTNNDTFTQTTVSIVNGPQHGTATVVNNQIVYSPNAGFAGNDTIVYVICDANCALACDTTWLRIYVYADVMVPELVTPNGDGSNDTWVINGLDKYPDHEVIIMNRWGDKIFVAKPYNNDWNGQTNVGILMGNEGKTTDGTYFYIINLSKDSEPLKGFLELRK